MKKLSILTVLTLILFLSFTYYIHQQNKPVTAAKQTEIASKQQKETLETYTYKITKVDSTGYYGTSTKDQTSIYFVNANVPKGTKINVNDTVKVSFPLNSYEEITHIEKLTN